MRYLAILFITMILLAGCNNGSSDTNTTNSVTDLPQPAVQNRDILPPKAPTL